MDFMGYIDGIPPTFSVIRADLTPDGSFRLEVPDLWNDPAVSAQAEKGYLWLMLLPIPGKCTRDDDRRLDWQHTWEIPVAAQYEEQKLQSAARPLPDDAAKPTR